ncbi:nuclear transport factor 2 family protein [Streptomyces monashensis]|uniref:nuclear transport factor 2 family protein n=1 Tax=Streptomyces monashensis TaxID=1678012 RepID=UPI0033CB99DD
MLPDTGEVAVAASLFPSEPEAGMTSRTTVNREHVLRKNLEVVVAHMDREAHDIEAALALYTDDVVWEAPARGVVLRGKDRIAENYRDLFGCLDIHSTTLLRQTATEEWVFNDKLLSLTITEDRIPGLDFPVGTKLSVRKLGAFQLRDGLICREISHESWRSAGGITDNDDLPPET